MGFSIISFGAFFASLWKAYRQDKPLRHLDVRQVIVRQIYFTGLQAFRLVGLAAVIIGVVTVAQSGSQLQRLGGADALGPLLVGAFIREIGPLVTVVVVVARSVAAIASELSSMKANGEIDGLRATGVSPLSYLVLPRVISGSISTLLLAMHFVWIALFVGYVVAQVYIDMPWSRYIDGVVSALSPTDLAIFLLKTFFLSAITFVIACFCGLRTTGTSFEIPQATTRAVMWSFMFCFGAQVLISVTYYFFLLQHIWIAI